jgi:hypothetical protein
MKDFHHCLSNELFRIKAALTGVLLLTLCVQAELDKEWKNDFAQQPLSARPALEVRYTDQSRTAFEILAQDYHLIGDLQKPHALKKAASGDVWLALTVLGGDGSEYSTAFADEPSRINLYRRGPYFCEIHWLDVTFSSPAASAPLRADVTLYCYPTKILISVTLHATDKFAAHSLHVKGLAEKEFALEQFEIGSKQAVHLPLFGEEAPLPQNALTTIDAEETLKYDSIRGCYTIGSFSPGGFQAHFYHHPNRYEGVHFSIHNTKKPRTIYVCHETSSGSLGQVEGGVLLDEDGFPLPITVQISKNFAGEKEEKFYNPQDTAFSETYFPLILDANESCELASYHLYQNWGRHMVKQFSSLGAWMDYFHSSTGVTETTCYVPFKFAGLPGVAIADFRAMSQSTFWNGQPQHDNIAGHSFLSYFDGADWQFLTYRGTHYSSTGPNWMDIKFDYLSSDGNIKAEIRTFELPQKDELRNFVNVRYTTLEPLKIENARENFRLMTAATWVQRLRYTHFKASGHVAQKLSYDSDSFPVRGVPLRSEASYAAVYGEEKGSNAFVLRNWHGAVDPAASVWCGRNGDSRLLLVPDSDTIDLQAGESIEFNAIILPYGEIDGAETPQRESVNYGSASPRVIQTIRGAKVQDFPTTIRAQQDEAEFSISGGKDIIPVIVTGLSDYRYPSIYKKSGDLWQLLPHSRVTDRDGIQVFCEKNETFGTVFLVDADTSEQFYKISVGEKPREQPTIKVQSERNKNAARIQAAWMPNPLKISFHDELIPAPSPVWQKSAGASLWAESMQDQIISGVRLTANERDVDIERWLGNNSNDSFIAHNTIELDLAQTPFAHNSRLWILHDNQWKLFDIFATNKSDAGNKTKIESFSCRAFSVQSIDKKSTVAFSWTPGLDFDVAINGSTLRIQTKRPLVEKGRRWHHRAKLYLHRGETKLLFQNIQNQIDR